MEIVNLAGGTPSVSNKELETSVQKLGFTFVGDVAGSPLPQAILIALIGSTKVTLTKQDGMNNVPLQQNLLLREVAEMSTSNKGLITIRKTDVTEYTVSFTIDVTRGGSLALSNRAKLLFSLDGKPAGSALTIDAHDDRNETLSYIKYEQTFVNQNTQKDFILNGEYGAAIPLANIVNVAFHYNTGKVVRSSKREIEQALRDTQDVVLDFDGVITYGLHTMAVIDLRNAWKIEVTLDTSMNFYMLKQQAI